MSVISQVLCKKHCSKLAIQPAKQHGVAVTELAIVLPLLALMFLSMVDIGRALHAYLNLTNIVYEGVRYGAALPGLERGTLTEQDRVNYIVQSNLRERVLLLLEDQQYDLSQTVLTTTYVNANAAGDPTDNRVIVSVKANLNDDLLLLKYLNVSVTASGPYLYPEQNMPW